MITINVCIPPSEKVLTTFAAGQAMADKLGIGADAVPCKYVIIVDREVYTVSSNYVRGLLHRLVFDYLVSPDELVERVEFECYNRAVKEVLEMHLVHLRNNKRMFDKHGSKLDDEIDRIGLSAFYERVKSGSVESSEGYAAIERYITRQNDSAVVRFIKKVTG